MANPKKIKLRVLLVALMLLACGTMALGGTFATQLDLDGTDATPLPAGKDYNVDVKYYDNNGYQNSLLSNDAIFTESVPWCPGYTKIVYLEVANGEAFPVECTLNMEVTKTGFGEVLKYAVIKDMKPDSEGHPGNWAEFVRLADSYDTLKKGDNYIFQDVDLSFNEGEKTKYFALAIHMDENATNQYQGKTLEMDFNFRINTNWEPRATPAFN